MRTYDNTLFRNALNIYYFKTIILHIYASTKIGYMLRYYYAILYIIIVTFYMKCCIGVN